MKTLLLMLMIFIVAQDPSAKSEKNVCFLKVSVDLAQSSISQAEISEHITNAFNAQIDLMKHWDYRMNSSDMFSILWKIDQPCLKAILSLKTVMGQGRSKIRPKGGALWNGNFI